MNTIDHTLLEGYLVRTRWFAGKGRPFRVSQVTELAEIRAGVHGPDATVYLITVEYGDREGGSERYQVPLAGYDLLQEPLAHAYVGPVPSGDTVRHLYDAVHDRDAMTLWLDGFIAAERDGTARVDGLRFRRVPGGQHLDPALRPSPMTGEQSNSSVRFDDTAIMKIFRKVAAGINPDVEIHEELTRGGSENVAALYGWVEADADGAVIQLAMLQEFLHTATDGFELAMGSIRTLLADPEQEIVGSGGDFAGEAARLGHSLAEVHTMLATRFPAHRRGPEAAEELARTMIHRLDRALLSVPELEPHAEGLRAVYSAVAHLDGLEVQRIHGDLHLGQTLRTSHGWRIVDFEGEPGRPLHERVLPDSPWRDVAGMLRSFDYATGVVEMSASGSNDQEQLRRSELARQWTRRAGTAFVDAYLAALAALGDDATRAAEGDHRALLDAYVADKAVYEVVYETRNRPAWAAIPLAALAEASAS